MGSWSVDDRVELVNQIWDSIADDSGVPQITDSLLSELDRRIAAYESDPSNVLTWEQIEAKLDAES
ncbi:MAG: addiction module protein [Planctomycetaceae bacterium]